ncbi:lectin subunit alpha-like [Haematobia irritans]|uniref:lectin subunit alpha-like n=1 Tax=Haematobia irritans TaxID=7368 RepID=UPI003F50566D
MTKIVHTVKMNLVRVGIFCTFVSVVFGQAIEKWHRSQDGSLFYIENERKFTWFGSWNECARKNMTLVAIDSYAKHMQLDSLIRKLYATGPGVWIGANDNDVTDRYEWYATGEIFTFTYWGPAQPKRGVNHCILIWDDFKWHDWPCTNKLGFVCEENRFIKEKNIEIENLRKKYEGQISETGKFRNFAININPTFDHVYISANDSVLTPKVESTPIN